MIRFVLTAGAVLLASASMPSTEAQEAVVTEVDAARGLLEWEKVHAVFSHPRCANCHVEDARPRWSGPHYGLARVHAFNVQRGTDGFGNPGLRCSTCHSETNVPAPHGSTRRAALAAGAGRDGLARKVLRRNLRAGQRPRAEWRPVAGRDRPACAR
jgi:hypothetical protein